MTRPAKGLWVRNGYGKFPLSVAQYSTNEAYQTAKAMTATGATVRTYTLGNLGSKAKKSTKTASKGKACNAKST